MPDYPVLLELVMLFLAILVLILGTYFSVQISDYFRLRRGSTMSAWDPSASLFVGAVFSMIYLLASGRGGGAFAIFVGTHVLFYVYRFLQWCIDISLWEAYVKWKDDTKNVADREE